MRFDRDAMAKLLKQARDAGATSIHMKVPGRVSLRIAGQLVPVAKESLLPVDTRRAVQSLMSLANTEFPLANLREHEFGVGIVGVGRFRVCVYMQRGSLCAVIHRLATQVMGLGELGVASSWGDIGAGLTFVGGQRRSELLAAVVDRLNARRGGHIVLLEDQVQVLHGDRKASISQREIGIDTDSWESGIRSAMRQAADILVIGEVPDPTIAGLVLSAAERGMTVLVGMPGGSPRACIDHFVSLFGEGRAVEVHQRVAQLLAGSMTLGEEGCCRLDSQELDRAVGC